MKENNNLKENDECPICHNGRLILIPADDPNSEYPIGGNFEDYLWCENCESEFEK